MANDRTTGLIKSVNYNGSIYEYSYDDVGNITSVTSNGNVIESYTYDNLNQLSTATIGTNSYAYTYDGGGNILSETKNGNASKTYVYGNTEWKDLLTSFNGQTITYDAIGNPLTYYDGSSFSWSDGRKLSSVTNGTNSYSYEYGADGLRTKKTVNGETTEYYWLGGKLYGQKGEDYDIYYRYDEKGVPIGFLYSSHWQAFFHYAYNAQGDIVGIIDGMGYTIASYSYDAWGVPTLVYDDIDNIGSINPLRYRGYYYDNETGFYYLQSRYYDPKTGRFINADSVIAGVGGSIQGYNMFAYCMNNPVNMSDSSGHWPQWMKNVSNWVNNNIIQPVTNFFSPSTNTISGQFQDGIFRGFGSLTGGYSEINGRLQVNSKDSKNNGMLGWFAKVSTGNASGKIGVGNDNVALSLKGVGDGPTATAQAGIQYKNGAGLAAKAKAAVLSGRATAELDLFGWQIEFGVSGDLLSVGAEAMIGVFPNEGFTTQASVGAGLFGVGLVFRVKPAQ